MKTLIAFITEASFYAVPPPGPHEFDAYHGTGHDFGGFDHTKAVPFASNHYKGVAWPAPQKATFFTSNPHSASEYANYAADFHGTDTPNVRKVRIKMHNPLVVNHDAHYHYGDDVHTAELIDHAKAHGHDGIILKNIKDGHKEDYYVVWHGHQVSDHHTNAKPIFEAKWHHGSPDTRSFKNTGFEPRTESLWNHETKNNDEVRPKPVYFTRSQRVARTYADPHRAFDYQGSVPGIITRNLEARHPRFMQVDAGGGHWSNMTVDMMKAAVPPEDHEELMGHIDRYIGEKAHRGHIMTDDVAKLAHKMGFHGFHIRNVHDDYNTEDHTKTTDVLGVFPEHLK